MSSMSAQMTLAPSLPSRRSVAAPMPEAPPVTIATLPSKRPFAAIALPSGSLRLEREILGPVEQELAALVAPGAARARAAVLVADAPAELAPAPATLVEVVRGAVGL